MSKTHLMITGLSCAGCVRRAETALAGVPGVARAAINFATKRAEVEHASEARPAALAEALRKAGYPAEEASLVLELEGMSCASCVGRAEAALRAVPGVLSAEVNLATRRAHIRYLAAAINPAALAEAVSKAGYPGRVPAEDVAGPTAPTDEASPIRNRFLLAALLVAPVFLAEMGGHAFPDLHHWIYVNIGFQTYLYLQFALITVALFGPGWEFFRKGIPALMRGAPEMNALVALGSFAAWSYSSISTFAPTILPLGTAHVYFEAAGMIVTLILLGRWLEARARGKTGEAIRALMDLAPPTARIERGGEISERPSSEILLGDRLHIRPGERLPTDGVVLSGASHVDESMITGEPLPVAKSEGDALTGGTLNGSGALVMRAEAVGSDTVLARIVEMVEDAQGAKLPIQALVDRITGWFVPAVLVIAALTLAAWLILGPDPALGLALVASVSVLIIACPCAMGLATPTSIMVGTGAAARMGLLFRRGDALQALAEVDVVGFDKTGTLTEGRPELADLVTISDWQRDNALALAAAVEAGSEHPVAHAITRAGEGLELPEISGFSALAGLGARASWQDHEVMLGSERLMTREAVSLAPLKAEAETIAAAGRTPLYLAVAGDLVAVLSVADQVKPSAREAVASLRQSGVRVVMLTGDSEVAARAVAAELGIEEIRAELMPGDKQMAIEELMQDGSRVAFVGDGINDAPALAAADIGIAIGSGTDIAIEAADLVLSTGDPRAVTQARLLSRAVMRNIRQNLGWAFGYNAALIPLAAGLFYPLTGALLSPVWAAGAMAASSVLVVSNALRLRRLPETLARQSQ